MMTIITAITAEVLSHDATFVANTIGNIYANKNSIELTALPELGNTIVLYL